MRRFQLILVCIVTLAAAVQSTRAGGKDKVKFQDLKFEGTLSPDGPKDPRRNTPGKVHVVALKAKQSYKIDMAGAGFDAYLRLEDAAGKELAEDDDSGGNLNAQIIFNCTKDGDYRIMCTCVGNANGKYVLTVKAAGAVVVPLPELLGKLAPDFRGDFALNGKPGKLSDLKGKVVLLDFWSIQSGSSAAALPHLREWHKQHKDAGLEVVGVTYYNSELGQRLRFDPAAGKVRDIEVASLATDRAMFEAFAAHHKLEHLLLVLHKDNALKAFNDYLVNDLPQLVLIDRQGIVRFTCVGDSQVRNLDLDAEIRKLLAEK